MYCTQCSPTYLFWLVTQIAARIHSESPDPLGTQAIALSFVSVWVPPKGKRSALGLILGTGGAKHLSHGTRFVQCCTIYERLHRVKEKHRDGVRILERPGCPNKLNADVVFGLC